MTSDPFASRRADPSAPSFKSYPCLRKGMTMDDFVREQNERFSEHPRYVSGELRWVVGHDGQPKLETQPDWLAKYQRDQARAAEEQRQRFNWRREHPIDEPL